MSNHNTAPSYTPLVRRGQGVSTASVGEWEKELMEDPKVTENLKPHEYNFNSCRTDSLSQL